MPFFKAGLKRNDFCIWVTTEPLSVKSAKTSLKKEIKDLDKYIKNKQMEIIHYNNWYTKGGKFNPDEVLKGFIEKEKWALERGFSGMRVSGDGSWINDNDWSKMLSYERTVNNVINEHKIRAICSSRNDEISWDNTFHLDANHQLSLVNRKGEMSYF